MEPKDEIGFLVENDGVVGKAMDSSFLAKREEKACENLDCVFCRIVSGIDESAIVYSDDKVISILDKYPVAKGHCLVMLRRHRSTLNDMMPDEAKVLFEAVHLVARANIRAMKAEGFNIGMNNGKAAGQTVKHVHVHVIPRFENDIFWCTRRPQNIPSGSLKSAEELQVLAELIRGEVQRSRGIRLAKL